MLVGKKHYKTVWREGTTVKMINQIELPFHFKIHECPNFIDTSMAIKEMVVRGAGAIGCTAALAMAQAIEQFYPNAHKILEAKKHIENTRPTAQNLFYATEFVYNHNESPEQAFKAAEFICNEDSKAMKKIGKIGSTLIKNDFNIETHCNAGWLAFTDFGSALAPIYQAKRQGKKITVYVDETRPRSQGARLTAWELHNENIEHYIIADNTGAFFMQNGTIDMMIVGADRIAANGDVANKIGTLEKAIAAHYYNIPFYVAAPLATFDLKCATGKDIPIEFRTENEILYMQGIENSNSHTVNCANPGSKALNPTFDVTPSKLISGIITEKGIIKPNNLEIAKLF